jgi:glycerol uptake facilitator-like aquaporin
MRDSYRHFVAEFVGTFGLVFIGGGAIMAAELVRNPAGITQVALAHGLILA